MVALKLFLGGTVSVLSMEKEGTLVVMSWKVETFVTNLVLYSVALQFF